MLAPGPMGMYVRQANMSARPHHSALGRPFARCANFRQLIPRVFGQREEVGVVRFGFMELAVVAAGLLTVGGVVVFSLVSLARAIRASRRESPDRDHE